tara:strand:+ start:218 stop:949 length:732 start_codon:yes stop_codon:yes gene_type:complete
MLIGFLLSDAEVIRSVPPASTLIFSSLIGAIFILNFLLYGRSLVQNGIGVSVASMRLSLLIPIIASVFFYDEILADFRYIGVTLVFLSIYFLLPNPQIKGQGTLSSRMLLLILFVFTGIADAALKIYEREFQLQLSEYAFLSILFGSAFILSLIILEIRKALNFSAREVLFGIILGVVNLYSSFFLILALQQLNGAIVFSVTNIGNVLAGALVGFFIWNDQVSTKQKAGLALAVLSILLLVIN